MESNQDGPYKVVEAVIEYGKPTRYLIEFERTGYSRVVSHSSMTSGAIRDRSRKDRSKHVGRVVHDNKYGPFKVLGSWRSTGSKHQYFDIEFLETGGKTTVRGSQLVKKTIRDPAAPEHWEGMIGKVFSSQYWGDALVVDFVGGREYVVQFLDTGHLRELDKVQLTRGSFRDIEQWEKEKNEGFNRIHAHRIAHRL